MKIDGISYNKNGQPRKKPKPGQGRKPVADEVLQKVRTIRMTDSIWANVMAAAAREDMPTMTWMRYVLEDASKR